MFLNFIPLVQPNTISDITVDFNLGPSSHSLGNIIQALIDSNLFSRFISREAKSGAGKHVVYEKSRRMI